jgi:hypothetical protein
LRLSEIGLMKRNGRAAQETTYMEMPFEDTDRGVTSLVLWSRLDTTGTDSIDLKFNAVAGVKTAVVVDVSNINLLTPLEIGVRQLGARAVKSKDGKRVLLSPEANVRSVLGAAKTNIVIPIFDDRNAAIAAVLPASG